MYLELYQLAAEEAGLAPVHGLPTPDEAFEPAGSPPAEMRALKEGIVGRDPSTLEDFKRCYETVIARGFELLQRLEVPVLAVAICSQTGDRVCFLAISRLSSDGTPEICRLSEEAPVNFVNAMKRMLDERDSSEVINGPVVIRPGADANRETDKKAATFWKQLTNTGVGLMGTKLRVWTERVGIDNSSDPDSRRILFIFPFGFIAPDGVRDVMSRLADIVLWVRDREHRVRDGQLARQGDIADRAILEFCEGLWANREVTPCVPSIVLHSLDWGVLEDWCSMRRDQGHDQDTEKWETHGSQMEQERRGNCSWCLSSLDRESDRKAVGPVRNAHDSLLRNLSRAGYRRTQPQGDPTQEFVLRVGLTAKVGKHNGYVRRAVLEVSCNERDPKEVLERVIVLAKQSPEIEIYCCGSSLGPR